MVRRWIGGVVAAVVVVGVGWLVVERQAQVVLDRGVAQFRERLGPDMRFDYASATPSVLHRSARFSGAKLAGPNGTVVVNSLVVGCDAASVCSGTADGVRADAKGAAPAAGTLDHVGWTNLAVPPGSGAVDTADAALDLVLGARFDSAELRNLHVTNGMGAEMGIDAIAMSEYGRGRHGRGTLDGLAVSGPAEALAAGPMPMQAGPMQAGPTQEAQTQGPDGVLRYRVGHLAYDWLDFAAYGTALRGGTPWPTPQGRQMSEVTDVDLTQSQATLLHMGRVASVTDTPVSGVTHWVVDATDVRPGWAALRRLGYERFTCDVHQALAFDRGTGELTIETLHVAGPGMGQATLSGQVDHVPGAAQADPAAMAAMTLRGLDLVLVDDGLMQRLLDEKAKAAGTSAAQLRDTVARQIDAVPMSSEAGMSVRAALAAFVRAPGTLSLGLHPATPLPLTPAGLMQAVGGAGGPDGMVQALALTAAAK